MCGLMWGSASVLWRGVFSGIGETGTDHTRRPIDRIHFSFRPQTSRPRHSTTCKIHDLAVAPLHHLIQKHTGHAWSHVNKDI